MQLLFNFLSFFFFLMNGFRGLGGPGPGGGGATLDHGPYPGITLRLNFEFLFNPTGVCSVSS